MADEPERPDAAPRLKPFDSTPVSWRLDVARCGEHVEVTGTLMPAEGPPMPSSGYHPREHVSAPNWWERFRGVTWQEKIRRAELRVRARCHCIIEKATEARTAADAAEEGVKAREDDRVEWLAT